MVDLIKKIKKGDKQSASQFVKEYYDDFYMYVLKLTLNKDISYDLTQEIFIRALKKIHTYTIDYNIKSWLYKIAYNYVMTYFKLSKNSSNFVSNEVLEYIPSTVHIESDIFEREDKIKIIKAIYQLDSLYKDIIIMRYYQDLSIKDIASILNMNLNTVKTRMSRGLDKLKRLIESGEENE